MSGIAGRFSTTPASGSRPNAASRTGADASVATSEATSELVTAFRMPARVQASGSHAVRVGVAATSAATAPNESWKPASKSAVGRPSSTTSAASPSPFSVSTRRSIARPATSTVAMTNARTTGAPAPATTV